ncbi:BURP domain protein RD22-like [Trifolium pratense]|uniref:BURP domain protein RD22-like n=1 Tax=Trifolium pratense TaxID=57577 RepID=UPI001E690163|nr:BURP domain protein RD22-like [Trifolium pratense]
MEFHLFHIITFLMFVVVGTNATILPPQLYWKSILPNTPMPKAITNFLHSAGYWSGWVDPSKCINLLNYKHAASETQLHDKSNVAIFFLENALHYGKKLNMQFTKTTSNNNGSKFLPKEVADSIPFSSNKMENILHKFSIKKGSKESEIVKNTINECEEKGIKGEEKLCVTSLESMVDFATSKLGNNVEAISTEVEKESSELQKYVIAKGVKKLGDNNKVVVCHKENYPYAVFYCHKMDTTKFYSVPLEGVDGNRVKAVAVCHTDTSKWNPKHIALQVLKVEPGTVPVCHFLSQDDVVWFSK